MKEVNSVKAKVNVPVLVIFFTRYDTLKLIVDAIKKAKPSKLFLYQDGAREGRTDDIEGVKKCRELFSDIDWDCEIHTKFQEKNYGCDPSEYIAIKWMFEYVDRGIILEDDDVPAQSFFPFCAELLEKYKDDEKIHMIAGMNRLETYPKNFQYDYFFSKSSSIWGWATWKRVVDTWDPEYKWMDDPNEMERMRKQFLPNTKYRSQRVNFDVFVNQCKQHKASGREHYETIQAASKFYYDRICITPTHNMIKNVGVVGESTHCPTSLKLYPHAYQKLFTMKAHDIPFPIKHPDKITIDEKYPILVEKIMGTHVITHFFRKVETKLRIIFYGIAEK